MRLLILLAALALSGCSTFSGLGVETTDEDEYTAYIRAQSEANALAIREQKPLVRITAQPGQPITGLASIEVYAPVSTPVIQQQRPSEWASVVGQGLSVVGAVMGLKVSGDAAIGLARAVGGAATAGYAHVQAPGQVTTNTWGDNSGANSGNSGRIAGGDVIDSTHAPTVVTQPAPVLQPAPLVVQPVIVGP